MFAFNDLLELNILCCVNPGPLFLCTKFEQKVSSHIKIFNAIAGGKLGCGKYQVSSRDSGAGQNGASLLAV